MDAVGGVGDIQLGVLIMVGRSGGTLPSLNLDPLRSLLVHFQVHIYHL